MFRMEDMIKLGSEKFASISKDGKKKNSIV
jgi:hypothetical protein